MVELARYLPGAYAGQELLRRGARVVRVEAPEGDHVRTGAPAWDEALRHGKESVVCALPEEAAFVRALCGRADVVLEGFRPGVAARLGVGPADLPASVVYCSITGFGERRARRAPATTSTTWGGPARWRTRRRGCRRCRSQTSPPAR